MEVQTTGRPVILTYRCDICNVGNQEFTGNLTPDNPPLFICKCTNCGKEQNLTYDYPTTRILPLE